ncbi:MAG: hypothetical protein PHP91_03930 [Pseudodesulfovibrio sp.]|nr:hypothetical protein [Pseudodesulfovibrio sp.]
MAPSAPTIRWIDGRDVPKIIAELAGGEARFVHFEDPALFADPAKCLQLCVMLRERKINILWSARMSGEFGGGRLRVMRMAGCRRIVAAVEDDVLVEFREQARLYGFEYVFVRPDGSVLGSWQDGYTVAELEAVAAQLPGVHAVQFDLAAACFNAGLYDKAAEPLAKAVRLGFPAGELTLHLLACLKGAAQYPEVAAGKTVPSGPASPHPVALRNRRLVRSWMEGGGGVRGARLLLDPETEAFPSY